MKTWAGTIIVWQWRWLYIFCFSRLFHTYIILILKCARLLTLVNGIGRCFYFFCKITTFPADKTMINFPLAIFTTVRVSFYIGFRFSNKTWQHRRLHLSILVDLGDSHVTNFAFSTLSLDDDFFIFLRRHSFNRHCASSNVVIQFYTDDEHIND